MRGDKRRIRQIVRECIYETVGCKLITETHMHALYHFVSPKQLKYITEHGFTFNGCESEYSISPDLPNYLSFTRNRTASVGFPYMNTKYGGGGGTAYYEPSESIVIRLEIDAEKLARYGKVKAFDYIYHISKEEYDEPHSSRKEIADMAVEHPKVYDDWGQDEWGQEIYGQPFSQAEERLFSKLDELPKKDALRLIKRIDIWVDYNELDKDTERFINWVQNKFKDKEVVLYDDIRSFNLQKNK